MDSCVRHSSADTACIVLEWLPVRRCRYLWLSGRDELIDYRFRLNDLKPEEKGQLTLAEHGNDFETDILLHPQLAPLEHHRDVSDALHHESHVLSQLVQGQGSTHHGG